MGSCCGKERGYDVGNTEEPSAWQLATMDDFYDSEVGEGRDEHDLVELQPSSMQVQRLGTPQEREDVPIPDGQVVSLDFNLAPRHSPLHRSSILGASGSSIGSSRDRTEALVLPEIRALNDLRGSGSFTVSSRTPTLSSTSSPSIGRISPRVTPDTTTKDDEIETALDQTVIVRNSESIYSYTYEESSTARSENDKTLGGVLSGEDDDDSVSIPLVSSSPSKQNIVKTTTENGKRSLHSSMEVNQHVKRPSLQNGTNPLKYSSNVNRGGNIQIQHSSSSINHNTNSLNYLPLEEQNDTESTLYEDALDSQAHIGVV